jgi:hypothetical protein
MALIHVEKRYIHDRGGHHYLSTTSQKARVPMETQGHYF